MVLPDSSVFGVSCLSRPRLARLRNVGLDLIPTLVFRLQPETGEGGPVSAATTGAAIASDFSPQLTWPKPEPLRLKVIEWCSIALVGGFLLIEGPRNLAGMSYDAVNLLAWLAAVAVTDLLYVPLWGTTLAMSFPILLAAAMLFPPIVAALLALVGTTDQREFRRQIPIGRSLYNRSQIALSVLVGSFLFHSVGAELDNWPWVLPAALLALIADSAVNFVSLIVGWRAAGMSSVRQGALRIFGPEPLSFILTYLGFGLTAVPLAIVYEAVGAWGLVAFVIPILLGHQLFFKANGSTKWRGRSQRRHGRCGLFQRGLLTNDGTSVWLLRPDSTTSCFLPCTRCT
jgi:hypothetical protein